MGREALLPGLVRIRYVELVVLIEHTSPFRHHNRMHKNGHVMGIVYVAVIKASCG